MNVAREDIAAAFFSLMQQLHVDNGGPFVTVTRVYQLPTEISWEQDPGLYVVEWNENVSEQQARGLEQYQYPIWCVILGRMPDLSTGEAPGSILNPLIDAVDNAIARTRMEGPQFYLVPPGEAQTLGGLVNNTFIEGQIQKADGFLAGLPHVIAKIPVSIVTGV